MAESSTYWIQDSAAGRLRKASSAGVSPAFDGLAPAGKMPVLPSRFGKLKFSTNVTKKHEGTLSSF